MKLLLLMLLILSASSVTTAQSVSPSQEPPDLAVVKFSWSKERVGWEQDPFSGPIENFDEMRVRARNEKRVSDAKRGGIGPEITRAERDAKTDEVLISTIHQNAPARYGFVYKVAVQNNSVKTIKAIDWDYVFFDINTEGELGRRQFASEDKIAPGKTKELKFFIPRAPTKTISVVSLGKNERKDLGESIVIVRVEYMDGSSWQRAQ
jgi:hypothetical protein